MSMSHPPTWRRQGLWPILQPATRAPLLESTHIVHFYKKSLGRTWTWTHLATAAAGSAAPRCASWSAERSPAPRSRWRLGWCGTTPPGAGWAAPGRNTPPGSDTSSCSRPGATPPASGGWAASAGSPGSDAHRQTRRVNNWGAALWNLLLCVICRRNILII